MCAKFGMDRCNGCRDNEQGKIDFGVCIVKSRLMTSHIVLYNTNPKINPPVLGKTEEGELFYIFTQLL